MRDIEDHGGRQSMLALIAADAPFVAADPSRPSVAADDTVRSPCLPTTFIAAEE
jgi:hypothetical protein